MGYVGAPKTFIAGIKNKLLLYDFDDDADFAGYTRADLTYTSGSGNTYPLTTSALEPVGKPGGKVRAVFIEVTPPRAAAESGPGCLGFVLPSFLRRGRITAGSGNISGNLRGNENDGLNIGKTTPFPVTLSGISVVLGLEVIDNE